VAQRPNDTSVSYADVSRALDEVEKAHHCQAHFIWYANYRMAQEHTWSIRLVAFWKGVGTEITFEHAVTKKWPHPDHRTAAGCMLALVYELDYKLEEIADRGKEAKLGQLRFA
jgi:hypothetical protein